VQKPRITTTRPTLDIYQMEGGLATNEGSFTRVDFILSIADSE
jgi:hypothetical protein